MGGWRSVTTILSSVVTDAANADAAGEALVGLTERYTWQDYDEIAASVAGRLRAAGIEPGDRVAVGFAKDARSYLAVHGILRAGAVVVPVDPLAPPLVARTVLEDAEVAAAFLDARLARRLDPWTLDGPSRLRLVVVDGPADDARSVTWDDVIAGDPLGEAAPIGPDAPAYIIYTSGSTGRPKGIVHTHASALAYAERAVAAHGLSALDRVAGMSPFHFDMSTLELYAAPLARSTVVVIGEAQLRFPASFTARSQEERVTLWYSVPALFRQVVERGALESRDLRNLRLVMYGGEPYSGGALAELMQALPSVEIENIYGPAEVNECTNHRVVRPAELATEIPIGRPWEGVALRVVDDTGAVVPAGTPGELEVSAPTVMAGYWRRPDLDERALRPRAGAPAWYATGDVVVADEDGVYWFKGRRDHQVKVRGVRIELEAVESVLTDAPDVLHAVVAAIGEPGEASHLAAAVVLRDGAELDVAALRQFCIARLPALAVPREIVVRPAFPSTPTSKIDRRSVRHELVSEAVS
jgi:amino acid adenylation domain-containing protein